MSDKVPYLTKENERWDTIAQNAYGDATKTDVLILANPTVSIINGVVPGGITIFLPVLTEDDVTEVSTELLPPWRQ